ncbi:hypothetical protein [Bifidobacterium pseudolongum]|uniref:Uncharacterized protein n=1 Tax=Bifidobacterium pseudolongum subsp. globosum TaxID=1690 RepID=A0A4Q5ASR2_9BIFI|nr:hypothetical protein [Bifidobacterium pseudolongum]RYQ36618.1 hypothetical protein PG2003B_1117 [Bifidobacterium pseudolongum subsp. globosum]
MSAIMNIAQDPICWFKRNIANGVSARKIVAGQSTGKWHYDPASDSSGWVAVIPNAHTLQVGEILYAHLDSANPRRFIEAQQTSADRMKLVWYRIDAGAVQCAWSITQERMPHNITLTVGPLNLLHAAAYKKDDWDKVYALYESGILTLPWISGQLLPDTQ